MGRLRTVRSAECGILRTAGMERTEEAPGSPREVTLEALQAALDIERKQKEELEHENRKLRAIIENLVRYSQYPFRPPFVFYSIGPALIYYIIRPMNPNLKKNVLRTN